MSLSFREQAAIAIYCTPTEENRNGATAVDTVDLAQALANACCKAWGHDGLSSGHSVADSEGPENFTLPTACARCGKEPDK